MHGDSVSLHSKRTTGHKRSTLDESASISTSETSGRSNRRLNERSAIFSTRLNYALVIIGLQTGVTQLMFMFTRGQKYGGLMIFLITFLVTIFITLPLMVQQMFYGFYNKYGFVKFWNIAPVGFGIGLSMALYSVYECVVWAAVAGLLILHVCHIPFRSLSEWTVCRKIERPEGVLCYDLESNLSVTSCELTTYPALEFYKKISYEPQSAGNGNNEINGAWFVCCFVVWLIVFLMVSQGFRRLKNILIRIPILCLVSLSLLVVFSLSSQRRVRMENMDKVFQVPENPSRYTIVWLVWHAIRVVQIPLGTLYQLGSYSPPGSPLLADAVMILLSACVFNSAFAYFAQSCHDWIELHFRSIKSECLAPDVMTALFASVPTAISFLAMGNLWIFVFYTAYALKTITQIVITLTATINAMSEMFHLHRHRQQIVAALCTVALLLNLPLTMMNSEIFLNRIYRLIELLVDLSIVSCISVLIVSLYTISRFFDDTHFIYNVEPTLFLTLLSYFSPILIIFSLVTAYTSVPIEWSTDPVFTANPWTAPFISVVVFLLLSPIPAVAFYMYVIHLMKHNITAMLQPTPTWGPPEMEVKRARLNFNPRSELKHKSKKPCAHNCLLNNFRVKIEVEKRDSQRKEFFLNIFQNPEYVEWDDDEDWHYGGDIIGKARAIDWAGDFGRVLTPMMLKETDEERRESETEVKTDEKISVEDIDVEEKESVDFEEDLEEDVHVEESTGNVDAIMDENETFISKKDTEIKTEMDFEPDIIFPDLKSSELRPRIRYLDTHDVTHRRHSSPRYTVQHPTHLQQRRSTEKRSTEIEIEPTPIRKMYPREGTKLKRQSRSKSCQTDKGLKRLQNLLQAMLPRKKNIRKKHRCVGTSPDGWPSAGFSKPPTRSCCSRRSEAFNETDEWP